MRKMYRVVFITLMIVCYSIKDSIANSKSMITFTVYWSVLVRKIDN